MAEDKQKEIIILLGLLNRYDPVLYRHIVGLIRALVNQQIKK